MEKFYVPLNNEVVSLEPITQEHIEGMKLACGDSEIWRWFTVDLSDPDKLGNWMSQLLEESAVGQKMTFAVRLKETGEVIGSSSFGNIDWSENNIEIGWTWIGGGYIGKGINKHMKFLMLRHAFEVMDIERLELRTDEVNLRSRRAMEKIGATYDAALRHHRRTRGDRRRTTVVYSILKHEWPEVKKTIFKEF